MVIFSCPQRLLVNVLAFSICSATGAEASAFLNGIQSATAAAVSAAGATAIAEDATTAYYNPAGMSLLDRPQIVASTGLVFGSSTFNNAGTTDALGAPVRGSAGQKDEFNPVPSVFVTLPLGNGFTAGFGMFGPFGQANGYAVNWVGRYQLQRTSLKTVEFDPALAFQVTRDFAVGAGLDVQYAHFVRINALDLGSLCLATIGPTTCLPAGLAPEAADGQQSVAAQGWNVGFNLSAIYNITDQTRLGLTYRSEVPHGLSGHAAFQVPANAIALTAGGLFQNTAVRSKLSFPAQVNFGLSQQLFPGMTLLADIDWTGWSSIKQLTLNFANPVQPTEGQALNWKDSMRFAVGGIYRLSESTDLRGGISYDETPIPAQFRAADLPDSDEYMFSAGFTQRFGESFSTTVSYSYSDFTAAPVNFSMPEAGTLAGTFHRHAHALGLQSTLAF
jgi:long-chain fatty acid transport protein